MIFSGSGRDKTNLATENQPDNAPSINKSLHTFTRKRKFSKIILFFIASIIFLLSSGFWLYKNGLKNPERQKTLVSVPPIDYRLTEDKVVINFGKGFLIGLDKKWGVEVVEISQQHSFLKIKENSNAKLEIETFSLSFPNWQSYIKNPLYTVEKTELRRIGKNQIKIEQGEEVLLQSKTKSIIGIWESKEKRLIIRAEATNQTLAEDIFNRIAETVSYTDNKTSVIPLGIKEAFAAENTTLPRLPKLEFKQLEPMAPLLEDRITKNDTPYKDGYARGYKFLAFKSQRLTAVAFEDRDTDINSYIHSQIFDANGKEVSKEKDTRIEFTAPYSGEYLFVVRTFNQREGKIKVGVDNRDQTEIKAFIKYPNGEELFLDPSEPSNILIGESEVGLIIQIPKPVNVTGEDSFEYDWRAGEFEPYYGRVTSKIEVFQAPDNYKSKGLQGFLKHIEDENKYRSKFKITQLGVNRLLITPKEGLFPKNHQVVVIESTQGITRFFTQNKPVIDFPIIHQIVNDYGDNFEPLTVSQFDWILSNGSQLEISGGWLQGSKPQDENQYNQLKQYFINRGYVVNKRNINIALPPYSVNNATKQSTGFVKEDVACRLEYIGILNIYCGNLF